MTAQDEMDQLVEMHEAGFVRYEHESIKPGVYVCNYGERQVMDARNKGTAVVIAVVRKEGDWEQKYGRKNIEILVRRLKDAKLTWWADYGTIIAEEQPT